MTETLYRITVPTAHRRVERLDLAIEREHTPSTVQAFIWDVPTPARDDDWRCDICSARLDPHAPILCAGITTPSYALCQDCAASVIDTSPDVPVIDCDCPGCQPPG